MRTKPCVICRFGERHPGITTLTLNRDGKTLIVTNVPADVCDSCGEAYLSSNVVGMVEEQAARAFSEGTVQQKTFDTLRLAS